MRTAFSLAALAAVALAVPYKRDVAYTDWDVAYVTDVVTVTAGQAPAAYTSASSSSEASVAQHYGHRNGWHPHSSVWTSSWATTLTEVVTQPTSTSTPAPAYTPPSTSTPEPETTIITTSTPVYQAPATTSAPAPSSTYVAPKSSAAPTTTASGYSDEDATYTGTVVDSHNLHRANHSASDIAWDHELYEIAKTIAKTCNYGHDTTTGGGGYGQNIAAGVDRDNIASVITDMFYNGEEWQFAEYDLYGQANPDMTHFDAWGHFTQLVWKDTTHVACYTTTEDDCSVINSLNSETNTWEPMSSAIPPYFTVCNYKNPGNYAGEYADNVGEPLGQPIAYASSSS